MTHSLITEDERELSVWESVLIWFDSGETTGSSVSYSNAPWRVSDFWGKQGCEIGHWVDKSRLSSLRRRNTISPASVYKLCANLCRIAPNLFMFATTRRHCTRIDLSNGSCLFKIASNEKKNTDFLFSFLTTLYPR